MPGKKIILGVRARLALVITLLLAGISGAQYYTNYRQQRAVIGKLVELNHQINETILDIDRLVKDRSQPAPAVFPDTDEDLDFNTRRMAREINTFLDYVDSNIDLALSRNAAFHDMLDHITGLRKLALAAENTPRGASSFFTVTVSVMDEMSRRSPLWRYIISSQPMLPIADDVLQVSIPVVEEGQVRFVHIQYQITDFLDSLRRARVTSLIVTLATLGLGLIFTLIFSGHFTRPIRNLSAAFNRVEEGDLGCRVEVERNDELGQLCGGFNHMVERLRQNKELEKTIYRQERLSSLGKLAGGIAHEIKNPLNAIYLSLQHLSDKLSLESPGDRELFERYSGNVQREVGRLSKIVDTFLNFSRVSDLERTPVDLNELLEDVLSLLARDAQLKGVRIETELRGGGLVKKVDPEKMKTVFLNLILNAIEAMPSGGKLHIRSEFNKAGRAHITISDTGCGIDPANLDHIFDLYFSTKEQGSGLGLSIVNNIIRDHGGEISVSSTLGTGTDFSLTLP